MSVTGDFADMIRAAEALGATLELRRIQKLIQALPPSSNDEWLFQMRVLRAITTPAAGLEPVQVGSSLNNLTSSPASVAAAGVPEASG